jgi:hypothetical protein
LALAASFAFASRVLATVWLVVLALSVLAEPIAPLRRAGAILAGKLRPPAQPVDPKAVRFATMAATAVLALGVVCLWTGLGAIGWLCVLAVAAAAALAALTQLCLGCEIYGYLRRRIGRTPPPAPQ